MIVAEGISVDIFIVGSDGTRLCTLRGFEMSRHSNSLRKPVEKRYQMEWQPVALPVEDKVEICEVRELHNSTRELWSTLDALAIQTIKETLEDSVVVGPEVFFSLSYI
jgi:hypothetical protein